MAEDGKLPLQRQARALAQFLPRGVRGGRRLSIIVFGHLYTITNVPVSRFASYLRNNGQYQDYLNLLADSFNPRAVEGLMCRDTINVSWTGEAFDCDFNQMLKLQWGDGGGRGLSLWNIDPAQVENREIATADHCFACTAGAGSSCGGALV